jgi:hypothetical protein
MSTSETRIKAFLATHPAIMPRRVEELAGVPIKSLGHFLSGRRGLPLESAKKIEAVLKDYGYRTTQIK